MKKLFHDLRLQFIRISILPNHQNLRLLKRFDMSIATKYTAKVVFLSVKLNSGAFEKDRYHFLISIINKKKTKLNF